MNDSKNKEKDNKILELFQMNNELNNKIIQLESELNQEKEKNRNLNNQ